MDLSIVIPAFNEAKLIEKIIDRVKKTVVRFFTDFEIIVVDDKSTDGTLQILRQIQGVRVLRNLKNHGKGYTVRKGVLASRGNKILFMDADDSTPIATELAKLLAYAKDYPIVIGSRALPGSDVQVRQNIIKVFLGKSGNLLVRTILNLSIHDTQCGFKLFDKSAKKLFEKLTIETWGFDFELMFLAKKYQLPVKELPVVWRNRAESSVRWYSYFITLYQVLKVRLNNLNKIYGKSLY